MLNKGSQIITLAIALTMSGNALAAYQGPQSDVVDRSQLRLAASSFVNPGGPAKKKICSNTYHAGGIRCTFCYYTTQPNSGSTVCIKIKQPSQSGRRSKTLKF
ncbi:MAG: hypothetical protein V3V97_01030 [Hyphomicrobiaceae bacterium]